MGWWRLGFARRGPQHRPARRPGGGQEPRHAGRGRTVGVRRGAPVQATRPFGYRGDAAARVRGNGAARCRRRSGARGGAAATGGPAPRCRPGVRRRRPPRDRRRGVRVAGRPARSAPPLMPTPLLDGFDFAALTDALAALGVDGWLVYDFRKVNPIAERILGPTGMGTRRLFVLLPRSGRPVAIAHRIELQPLAGFPGAVLPYGSWRELHGHLGSLVRGRTLAVEISPLDQVPYLDRLPHGVVQLLESFG